MGLGTIIGGIGKAIGVGTSFKNLLGLGNSNWEEQMEQQFQNEKEMMGLQHQYNEAMAQQNQQFNKEMWDYTNYENQKKHLEAAGLNPALLYGMSGEIGRASCRERV